jgi:TRAP-type C4-dicarboxylate transport system permease small subunit
LNQHRAGSKREVDLRKYFRFLSNFESSFTYVLIVFLTIVLFVQIVNRYVFQASFVWLEEIARISFVWLIYFSVASAARENRHIRVGLIDLFVPASVVRFLDYLADALVIVFNLVILWLGIELVRSSYLYDERSPVTDIPMGLIYAVIPFCFALMAVRILGYDISSLRGSKKALSQEEAAIQGE